MADEPKAKVSQKEYARQQRQSAYQLAKERRQNDPKHVARLEAMKEYRRAAYQAAKERLASDPKQVARKEALKQREREFGAAAKERRKQLESVRKTEAADRLAAEQKAKDQELMKMVTRAKLD